MSIWNKILIGLIFVASAAFFYLAMATLKTHQVWMQSAEKDFAAPLAEVTQKIETLQQGDALSRVDADSPTETMGLVHVRVALHDILADRGRVWYQCAADNVLGAQGEITLSVPVPTPHGIGMQHRIYVFEEKLPEQLGAYLGEFTVSAVNDVKVTLLPTMTYSPEQLQRATASVGSGVLYTLYELMPRDRYSTFAGLTEQDLNNLFAGVPPELRAEVVAEYLKHGQPVDQANPPSRTLIEVKFLKDHKLPTDEKDGVAEFKTGQTVAFDVVTARDLIDQKVAEEVGRKYQRELRDYAQAFHSLHREIRRLNDLIAGLNTDISYLEAAAGSANSEIALRTAEIDQQLKPEKEQSEAERDLMQTHRDNLLARLQAVRDEINSTLADNKRIAAELAAAQREAARRIEEAVQASASE